MAPRSPTNTASDKFYVAASSRPNLPTVISRSRASVLLAIAAIAVTVTPAPGYSLNAMCWHGRQSGAKHAVALDARS